jgi:hypothetical protein
MWIITPDYFASAVAAELREPGDERNLIVRFRSRADLDAFLRDLDAPDNPPLGQQLAEAAGMARKARFEPLHTPHADYPWKVKVPAVDVANVVAHRVETIDYHNFKNEVTKHQGHDRHDTYLDVWSDLRRIEKEPDAETGR